MSYIDQIISEQPLSLEKYLKKRKERKASKKFVFGSITYVYNGIVSSSINFDDKEKELNI